MMHRTRYALAGLAAGFVLAPLVVVAQLALSGPSLDLYDADSSHKIRIQPPTSVTANRTVTLEDDSTPFDSAVTFGTEAAIEAVIDLPDLQGILTAAKGGTGQNSSASSGIPEVNAGTWSFGASVGDLAASTSAALAGVITDETGSGALCFATSPTLVTPSITGLTANRCVRTNASGIVEVAAGDCGSSAADIEAVFTCANGDCSALTAGAGDSLDMTAGDSSAPCKSGTSPPGTCSVGQCFFDTDATAGQNIFGCTATNTWTLQGDGGGAGTGDIEAVWTTTSGTVDALTAAAGDSLDATAADATAPCKTGTSPPGTCTEGQCFHDTDSSGSEWHVCTATNTWTAVGGTGATLLVAGTTTTVSTGSTSYVLPTGFTASTTTEVNVLARVQTGTLSTLTCSTIGGSPDNGGGTQSYTFTARVGSANSAMTCTISETVDSCSDASNTATVAGTAPIGQFASIGVVPSGTPTALRVSCAMRWTPS